MLSEDEILFTEMMLRAPSCPEWYKPKFPEPFPQGEDATNFINGIAVNGPLVGKTEKEAQKIYDEWEYKKAQYPTLTWPTYYAQEVLRAADKIRAAAINAEGIPITIVPFDHKVRP